MPCTGRYWCKGPRVVAFSKGDPPSFSSVDPELIKLPVFPWHCLGINSRLPVPFPELELGIFLQMAGGISCPAYLLSSLPVLHLSERFSRNYLGLQCYDRRGPLIPATPTVCSFLLPFTCLLHLVQDIQVSSRSSCAHPQLCARYFKVFG